MFWLVVGYMFLFIFRPFEYWEVLGDFRIERIYMIILLIAVALDLRKRFIKHPINIAVIAFSLAMLVSASFSYFPQAAFKVSFDYLKLVVFYFVLVVTLRDEEQFKKFILAYIGIMLLYVGKSAWEFFLHDRYVWRMGIRRMVGIDSTYGDPNAFAASIAYSLPFVWAMIRLGLEQVWQRRALWVYGVLAVVSIIYTGSRSGMVTLLLFFALIWLGGRRKIAGMVVLTALLGFTWIMMPDSLQMRFESIYDADAGTAGAHVSAQGRTVGFKQGIALFKQYPVLGIGPGNFRFGWDDGRGANAHNLYGLVLGEFGAVGTASFAALLICTAIGHRQNLRRIGVLEQSFPAQADTPSESALQERTLLLFRLVAIASLQTMLLMLFKGWADHNLYRYNWLWIGALAVLTSYFLSQREGRRVRL